MESNQNKYKNRILDIIEYIPGHIDAFVHWVDDIFGGVETCKSFNRRSFLAFFLPIPIYFFIIWGPTLAKNSDNHVVWRGGLAAVFLIAGALMLQLVYFLRGRHHLMAWVHFGLTSALVFFPWMLASSARVQASNDLYRHYYGLLAFISMVVAVPIAAWLRHRSLFAPPAEDLVGFHEAFNAEKVVAQASPRKINKWDVIGAWARSII